MKSENISIKNYDPEEVNLLAFDERKSKTLPNKQTRLSSIRQKYLLIGIILSIIVGWLWLAERKILKPEEKQDFIQEFQYHTKLPKIIWIYTRQQVESERPERIIYYNYLRHVINQSEFQVRVVNSWSANDWLSQPILQKISKTIHKSQLDETVDNLLKMALLIEHGGVLLDRIDTIFLDGFKWLQQMFASEGIWNHSKLKCNPNKSQIFMPTYESQFKGKIYLQNVIAAVPNSKLIKQAFEVVSNIILTGVVPYNDQLKLLKHNQETGINYVQSAIQAALKIIFYRNSLDRQKPLDLCNEYGFQALLQKYVIDFNTQSQRHNVHLLQKNSKHIYPLNIKLFLNIESQTTKKNIRKFIFNYLLSYNLPKESILFKVFQSPGNKEIFLEDFPQRKNIQLCLIVLDDLATAQITQLSSLYRNQTYQNWKLIVFASDIAQATQPNDQRQTILQSSFNQVRNIEVAATQHCNHSGYAVLLHFGDTFNSQDALSHIALKLTQQRGIVGASIDLKIDGKLFPAKHEYLKFSRALYGQKDPKIDLMEGILNHMRIFAIDSFRYLPQFQFRNMHGQYFKDRLIILMPLLQLIKYPTSDCVIYKYCSKKYAREWNLPNQAILMSHEVHIKTDKYENLDRNQLIKTKDRPDVEQLGVTLLRCMQYGINFKKIMVFNKGAEFVPVEKKEGPNIIPKIIHQVWVGSPMPYAKRYFLEKTKKMYPDYEFMLYGEENLTRQRFPLHYDIIMNLLDYHKHRKPKFGKLATVTDLIRHEALYRVGGFWRDSGTNPFKPVYNYFLKYDLVVGAERTLRYRWNQGMCFFANAPGNENIYRVASLRNVNRVRFYLRDALLTTGPVNFRLVLDGDEQQAPNILVNHYEYFYPGEIERLPFRDLCTKYTEDVVEGDPVQFVDNGCAFMSNCDQAYPEAYSLDHNCFGVSWRPR